MALGSRLSLNTPRDEDYTTSLNSLFQYLITLSGKKFLLMPNLNSPVPLGAVSSCPVAGCLGEEPDPPLLHGPFRIQPSLEEQEEAVPMGDSP